MSDEESGVSGSSSDFFDAASSPRDGTIDAQSKLKVATETIRTSNIQQWLQQATNSGPSNSSTGNIPVSNSGCSLNTVDTPLSDNRSTITSERVAPGSVLRPQSFFDELFRKEVLAALPGSEPMAQTARKTHRDRTVSWDASIMMKPPQQPQPKQPAKPMGGGPSPLPPLNRKLPPVAPSKPKAISSKSVSGSDRATISVVDVMQHAPTETEADREIMNFVEETDPMNRGRQISTSSVSANSTGHHIMPNLPLEAIMLNPTGSAGDSISIDGESITGRSKPALRRALTSQRSVGGTNQSSSETKRLLLAPKPQTTVSQHLDGLTDTLEAMHQCSAFHQAGKSPVVAVAPVGQAGSASATDKLNKAANVMYQRRKNTETSTDMVDLALAPELDVLEGKKPASHWGALRAAHKAASLATNVKTAPSESPNSQGKHDFSSLEGDGYKRGDTVSSLEELKDIEEGIRQADEASVQQSILGAKITEVPEAESGRGGSPLGLRLQTKDQQKKPCLLRCFLMIPGIRDFIMFSEANKGSLFAYFNIIVWIILPAFGAACILFYLADNPPIGRVRYIVNGTKYGLHDKIIRPDDKASYSFIILFYSIRQLIALTLAHGMQLLVIDFFCVGRQWTARYLGAITTLLIVQSRGWPFILIFWSLFDMALNFGAHKVRLLSFAMFRDIGGSFDY